MEENYKLLIEYIIKLAIKDLNSKNIHDKNTALIFLNSNWCKELIQVLNIEYGYFQEKLNKYLEG